MARGAQIESGEDRTVVAVLRNRAERIGDQPWIVTDHDAFTYAHMETTSNRLAHGLSGLGIEPGETMLLVLPNTVDFLLCWCAIAKISALEVPINTAYRGTVLKHQVNDSRARTVIVAAEFLDRLDAIAHELEHLKRCVITGAADDLGAAREAAPRLAARCDFVPYGELFAGDAPG